MKLKNSILAGCTALCGSHILHPKELSRNKHGLKKLLKTHTLKLIEIDTIESSGRFLNPVTLNNKGGVYYCGYADWRSGFFPAVYGICMN